MSLTLGKLLKNLKQHKKEFSHDQTLLIENFLKLVYPFLREASKKAHYIIEYLENIEELKKLKIPEMVELLLAVIKQL